jgi:hypothetical protein
MHLVEPPEGTFTTQELERLVAYRAAVQSGFYSDWYDASSGAELDETASAKPTGDRPRRRRVQPKTQGRVKLG